MRRILWHIILLSLAIHDVQPLWESPAKSQVQLLGLFMDDLSSPFWSQMMIQCRAMFKAALSLAQTLNVTIDGQPIGWQLVETHDDVISTLEYTCLAVSRTNVAGIVGPRLSREAHIISKFAQRIGIPVVSYSATDPDLSDQRTHPAFYRTIPSDASAALAIAKLFKRYNWSSGILIHQNDAFGSSGVRVIGDAFRVSGITIADAIVFDVATQTIQGNLAHRLRKSATRVVVLWADSTFTASILQEAVNQSLLGPRYLWILSVGVSLDGFDQSSSDALIGMLVVEPASEREVGVPVNAPLLSAAYEIWKQHEPESFPGDDNVSPYALFAFDATWLLIQALQQLCASNINHHSSSCLSFGNSSFCFDHQLENSSAFFRQISATKFDGVSGPIAFHADGADRTGGIHYVTRNAQPSAKGVSFVAALKYSEPGEWLSWTEKQDVLWPGETYSVPRDRANISGVKLRIGIIDSRPFTMINYTTDEYGQNKSYVVGYMPDLIALLQQRMEFIPEIVMTPPNQSYSAVVQAVANGDYDMVVGDVTISSSRRKIAAFSSGIFDSALRLIIRKPTVDAVDFFAYLRPFSLGLWMVIFATTIFTSMLVCFVERQDNDALRDRSTISMGAMSIWYSLGHIMGYGVDFHVTTISGRILTVALYVLSLVLVATYTANLASNLTISKTKYIISSIDDMKQGKIPFNRIGIRVGTSEEEYFVREISEGSRNFYPLKSRQDRTYRLLNGDIDASFIDSGPGTYLTNNIHCNLTLVGPGFDARRFGIVFQKNWMFIEDFDRNVLALRESGQLDKLRKRWFESNLCRDADETPNAMGVDSLAGLFLTVVMIICIALLALAWTKRMLIKNRLHSPQRGHDNVAQEPDVVEKSSY